VNGRTADRDSPDLRWLLDRLVEQVAGVDLAVVLSADGLLLSQSRDATIEFAEGLSAMCSALSSLARSGARHCARGLVRQTVVEMDEGFLMVAAVGQGTSLAVLASADVDIGTVAYEMQVLGRRVGRSLAARPRSAVGPAEPRP
jgi:predicted regulator of Ras-like GTPase activity (Roadblock/LC7/MglB family)